MIHRTVTRWLCLSLAMAALAAQEPAGRTPHAAPRRDVSPRTAAWLDELLGPSPHAARGTYQRIVDDSQQPREQRVFAATRLLLLEAGSSDSGALARAQHSLAQLHSEAGRPLDLEPLTQRLTHNATLLRQALARSPGQPDLAQLRGAFAQSPLPTPLVSSLRALFQDAEAPGDRRGRGEAEDPGRGRGVRRDFERSPRGEQLRRWIRDAIESELAGEADKARRLRGLLAARGRALNTERGGLERVGADRQAEQTLQRLEERLTNSKASGEFTPRERAVLRRALDEARRRLAANDLRGAYNLLWPATQLERGLD